MFKKRPDGTYIKKLDSIRRIMPYLIRTRTESTIYFEQEIDVTETLNYLKKKRRETEDKSNRLTFFELVLCAAVRTITLRPQLNRFVSGFDFYQRNQILFNFIVKDKLSEDSDEMNVLIPFDPYDTLDKVQEKVRYYVEKSRKEGNKDRDFLDNLMKMPRWMIQFSMWFVRWLNHHNLIPESMLDPAFCSIFFTNVGSIGLDAPHHHLFEWGTNSLFISIGKFKKSYEMDSAGVVHEKTVVRIVYTIDDRIVDGIYCGSAMAILKGLVENPKELETKPELEDKLLSELNLKSHQNFKS